MTGHTADELHVAVRPGRVRVDSVHLWIDHPDIKLIYVSTNSKYLGDIDIWPSNGVVKGSIAAAPDTLYQDETATCETLITFSGLPDPERWGAAWLRHKYGVEITLYRRDSDNQWRTLYTAQETTQK